MLAKAQTVMNDGFRYCPGVDPINLVYKNTSRGSLLGQMVLDMYVEEAMPDRMDDADKHYTYDSDFMAELALGLMGKRGRRRKVLVCVCSVHWYMCVWLTMAFQLEVDSAVA